MRTSAETFKPVSFLNLGDSIGVKTVASFRSNGYAAPQANAICQSIIRFGLADKSRDPNGHPALTFRRASPPSGEEILERVDALPEYGILAERFGWSSPPPEAVIAANLEAADGFSSTAAKQLAKVFLDDARLVSLTWTEIGVEPHWRWASPRRREASSFLPVERATKSSSLSEAERGKTSDLVLLASLAIGDVGARRPCDVYSSVSPEKLNPAYLRLIAAQIEAMAEELERSAVPGSKKTVF